jgi:hypothetical protein
MDYTRLQQQSLRRARDSDNIAEDRRGLLRFKDSLMNGWFDRRFQRQRELRQGADADLVGENRKRWKLAWCLWGSGLVLGFVQTKVRLPAIWHSIAVWLSVTAFLVGAVLLRWGQIERNFLNRPDPEGPPKIFK